MAQFHPEISVLMPVRNGAQTIRPALESVSRQTFSAWELLVIDDGSADGTLDILREFAANDARIRVLTQPTFGVVEALQRGCLAAQGKFLARMDADDFMHPERLQRQLEFLEKNPEIGVVSCLVDFGGNRQLQSGYAAHVAWINSLVTPEEIFLRRFVESPLAHPSVMFRRTLLEKFGGYLSGDFPEDYELWLRWMEAGVRFGKVNRELLIWNDPPARLSRTDPRYRAEAFYKIKCQYLARWLSREVQSGRAIWLWGAGRITRKRFRTLESEGIRLAGFIDIDPEKAGILSDGRPVVLLHELPSKKENFILAGVASRGAREKIGDFLRGRSWVEGKDFLLAG